MARPAQLISRDDVRVVVRLPRVGFRKLLALRLKRYPDEEWATFARFGWRETAGGLVLTMAAIDEPGDGDLDDTVGHVAIQEPYTLRMALAAERHPLALAVFHSHPRDYRPQPSHIDDDMDRYYADYFSGFAPGRPYASLILSEIDGKLAISGRVYWRDRWLVVQQVIAEATPVATWVHGSRPAPAAAPRKRLKRLASAFGDEADRRLRSATVAVIGAGGTGSAAIEILARAGVGRLIVVDPDVVEESNLERLHGGTLADANEALPKVLVAKRHVATIDSGCEVVALRGALPQSDVVDAVLEADVALGCTDQHHSRLALSDLACRYLVPALDCAVRLEGAHGSVTGQIVQLVRFLSDDPCALCREMVLSQRVTQELMSPEEIARRRRAAAEASARGEAPDPYWQSAPQINTVGYLTSVAGSLAAAYAIGWLTGRFEPPLVRLQMNLVAPFFDVTDYGPPRRQECTCGHVQGWAEQARADAFVTAPDHWPPVVVC